MEISLQFGGSRVYLLNTESHF